MNRRRPIVPGRLRRCSLLLVILAAACAAAPTPTATPSAAPPSATAPASASAPASEPTPDPTAIIDSIMAHGTRHSLSVSASPDQHWRVEVVRSDCTPIGGDSLAYEQMLLETIGASEARVLADQIQSCGGLGAFGLQGLYWSSDSRFFYYTPAREGQPDGGCGPWQRPIVRVDVRGGGTLDLAEGTPAPAGAATSEGGLTASFVGQDLVLWSRAAADVLRVPAAVPAASFGPLAWSPDGQSLVYLAWRVPCPPYEKSDLVRVDLPGSQAAVLPAPDAPIFTTLAWPAAGQLRLTDAQGQAWTYDLAAQTLRHSD